MEPTTETKRRLNLPFTHFPWRRKQQRQQQQQEQQQQRQQQLQPPHIPTHDRRTFEPTSEPEPERDLTSLQSRRHTYEHAHTHTTHTPTHTYPQTYPRPRARSRTSTSETERDRIQIPYSTAHPRSVQHGPKFGPATTPALTTTPAPTPWTPADTAVPQPPRKPFTATSSIPSFHHPPPPPHHPTPSVPLQRRSQQQLQQQQQQPGMATEHRDHRDTKAGLRTWWQQFTTARPSPQHSHSYPHSHPRSLTQPHEYVRPPAGSVFGRPLKESLKYANVQISTADASGKLYVWGYIPVVVAKWCV